MKASGLFPSLKENPAITFDYKDGLMYSTENTLEPVTIKDSTNIIPTMRFEYTYTPKVASLSQNGYVYTEYEDENDNYNYEQGQYTEIPFTWDEQSQTLTIGKRQGEFEGMLRERTFRICKVSAHHATGDLHAADYDAVIQYTGEEVSVALDRKVEEPAVLTDCTIGYIQNHSFEDDGRTLTKQAPRGWTVSSNTTWWGVNQGGGNEDPSATDGNFIFGVWDNNVLSASISQPIRNLPSGKYTLTVDIHAPGRIAEARLGNQRLFANDHTALMREQFVTCGTGDNFPMQTLALSFTQERDGAPLTIGVATDGAPNQTWFKIDNFRLYAMTEVSSDSTSVSPEAVVSRVVRSEVFSVSGQRILQCQEGVNVVREYMSDGTQRACKVVCP